MIQLTGIKLSSEKSLRIIRFKFVKFMFETYEEAEKFIFERSQVLECKVFPIYLEKSTY